MDTRETSVTLSASASTRRLAVVSGHVGLLQVHAVPFSCTVAATTTAAVEGLYHLSPPRPLRRRPRVAAIVTAYFPQSHADVIITKLIKGYSTDAGFVPPSVDIVSLYMDQCPLVQLELLAALLPVSNKIWSGVLPAGWRQPTPDSDREVRGKE